MSENWKNIWARRCPERPAEGDHEKILAALIAADGFDSGRGKIPPASWRHYTEDMRQWLAIPPKASIYELGCGAGAFLYPFYCAGHPVGGMDYSEALIARAREVMQGDFSVGEAIELPETPAADFVVANGVFFYFPDLKYAEKVLKRMLKKARCAVLVADNPNAATREACENMRRAMYPPGEYEKKFAGLGHLYFQKQWFEDCARKWGYACAIRDQAIESYGYSGYRFNVVLRQPPA